MDRILETDQRFANALTILRNLSGASIEREDPDEERMEDESNEGTEVKKVMIKMEKQEDVMKLEQQIVYYGCLKMTDIEQCLIYVSK